MCIRDRGKCRPLSENAIEGLNTIYFINSPGNYTDCMLQVVDFAGNKSDNITLSDFQVIQAEGQSVGFGMVSILRLKKLIVNTIQTILHD